VTNQPAAGYRSKLAASAGLLLTSFLWGSQVPLTSLLLIHLPPFLLAATRYSLGALVLALLVAIFESRPFLPPGLPWLRIFLLGGLGIAGFGTCFTFGIWYSGPITAAAILATGPVVAAIMDRVVGGRRLAPRTLAAVAIAVIGGLIAAFGGKSASASAHGGEILIVIATVLWTWYSMKAQSWLTPLGIGSLRLTMVTAGAAGLTLWAIYALTLGLGIQPFPSTWPPPLELAILGYLIVFPTAISIFTWNYGTGRLGVTVATLFINLSPLFSVLVGIAIGTQPTAAELVGGALAIGAVLLLQLG
jgi:drug/metabolite transporter (DMT)-like permease